ncbi:MAG: hypothetical protein DWQ18_09270 [Crenarchaeota archaeon]|mgnify:CR=1 FL=1|nr:MAG: hypothetical protein DWQ17_00515 [Thermoproteota archaeon]RDJ33318.1 MAG: hypothetical protein DWQ18_09270 [Thermoproteota archaeon]RDJ36179.1 MAG: hypothetical protein DWQ19_06050 [Thermoproteota archaeon]RDJ38810.1 MAG: hypothetical protein DWQ13_00515 [Thermoproteota archaeon]
MNPNILFLVIDSFRADKFIGINKTSVTPNLDYLIKSGTYFKQAISSSDATLVSEASTFTGLFPIKSGVRSHKFNKIRKDVKTYFQIFGDLNYKFYGYFPQVAMAIGLLPNFENSDKSYARHPTLVDGAGKRIIEKLQSGNMNNPWFFYIHCMDLHFPISIPSEFDNKKFGTTKYDRQISAIDFWIGKIIKCIDLKNTLVVITADHGSYNKELYFDNNEINFGSNSGIQKYSTFLGSRTPKVLIPLRTKIFVILEKIRKKRKIKKIEKLNLSPHEKRNLLNQRGDTDRFVYDDLFRIPLLLVGPGIQEGKIISQQVRSIDICPTISHILGLPNRDDEIDGRSLIPFISGEKTDDLIAFMESEPLLDLKSNNVIGIRTPDFKYFRDRFNPNKLVHLYDLRDDPNENNNLARFNLEKVSELEKILQDITKNYVFTRDNSINVKEAEKIESELRKLGYI